MEEIRKEKNVKLGETTTYKDVLTSEEVAVYTGHTIKYIYKLCSQRKIPHYNSSGGRRLYFRLDEIIEWCTANKVKTVDEILKSK